MIGAVLITVALSACSSMMNQLSLSDPPTALDEKFGGSVAKMIEIQSRPVRGDESIAGYQLEGWEAEKIISSYNKNN